MSLVKLGFIQSWIGRQAKQGDTNSSILKAENIHYLQMESKRSNHWSHSSIRCHSEAPYGVWGFTSSWTSSQLPDGMSSHIGTDAQKADCLQPSGSCANKKYTKMWAMQVTLDKVPAREEKKVSISKTHDNMDNCNRKVQHILLMMPVVCD